MITQTSLQIKRLLLLMERTSRFAIGSVNRALNEFGTPWETDFAALLNNFYGAEGDLEDALKGYGAFVMDSMRRQKRFEFERSYPVKSYAEASAEVYLNANYMRRQYLPGLLLSHYLWPHHYRQIEYFKALYLPWLRQQNVAEFAEVGVGTGIYSRLALQAFPQLRGIGIDISPLSLEFSNAHVTSFGYHDRYSTLKHNVIEEHSTMSYRAVFCVELLEHLEDPTALLISLKDLCAKDGKLFVTAALYAARDDHIYLYRNPQEVLEQVDTAGLDLEHYFLANAYISPKSGVPVPSALAMVLTPRN